MSETTDGTAAVNNNSMEVRFYKLPKKRMEPGKFLMLVGFLGTPLSFAIANLVSIVLAIAAVIISMSSAQGTDLALSSPEIASLELVVSLYAMILGYALFCLFPFVHRAIRLFGTLGLSPKVLPQRMGTATVRGALFKAVIVGTVVTAIFGGAEILLGYIINRIPALQWFSDDYANSTTTSSSIDDSAFGTSAIISVLTIVATALIIPICEEFIFRGITAMSLRDSSLWKRMGTKLRTRLICAISGLYFGIAHWQTEADISVSLYTVILMTAFGIVMTYLAAFKYKSLAPTIWAHILNNALSFVL